MATLLESPGELYEVEENRPLGGENRNMGGKMCNRRRRRRKRIEGKEGLNNIEPIKASSPLLVMTPPQNYSLPDFKAANAAKTLGAPCFA